MKIEIIVGDSRQILKTIESSSVQCIVTSPPFMGLRTYHAESQIGLECTIPEYINSLMQVFDECKRVLKPNGVFWLNLGDVYAQDRGGSVPPAQSFSKGDRRSMPEGYNPTRDAKKIGIPHKSLIGIPWRVALALQDKGWIIRSDIIWQKTSPTPEKVKDRPIKSHEYLFLLAKSEKYFFDHTKIENKTIWKIGNKGVKQSGHTATFPVDLVSPCVLSGSQENDLVLDPFSGTGTVGVVCRKNNRNYIGIELNPKYAEFSVKRINNILT